MVKVGLLTKFLLPNQNVAYLFDDEVSPFAHEVFCQTTLRPGWILASPIAIWTPHNDAEDFEKVFWADGATTRLPVPVDAL